MSATAEQDKTRRSLARALAENRLPDDVRDQGERLLARLDAPIKVSLLGLPGSGKSSIMTLLLGQEVVPSDMRFPTTQISASASPQTHLTLPDGTKTTLPGIDPRAIVAQEPLFVHLELSLPALNKISVMELVTSSDRVEQIRALSWAAQRTDIAIWATQSYSEAEHVLWREMPDDLKDHAILLRTKADQVGDLPAREDAVDDLRRMAGDHFSHVMPLATLDAISARRADGTVDKGLMRSSGGTGLISTIMRQIDLGQQSTVDQAAVLLHKHGLTNLSDEPEAQVEVTAAKPDTQPEPEMPTEPETPAEVETPDPAPDTSATNVSKVISRVLSRPIVADEPAPEPEAAPKAEAEPAPEPTPDPEPEIAPNRDSLPPELRPVFEGAASKLADVGRKFSDSESIEPADVIRAVEKALKELDATLADTSSTDTPHVARLSDAVVDAQDMVQLMLLEQDGNAAIDAASTLVQIRRQLLLDLGQ